jgi:hypothetical protein
MSCGPDGEDGQGGEDEATERPSSRNKGKDKMQESRGSDTEDGVDTPETADLENESEESRACEEPEHQGEGTGNDW